MKKRLLVLAMVAVMATSVTACGDSSDKKTTTTDKVTEQGTNNTDTKETETKEKKEDKSYIMKCNGENLETGTFGRSFIYYSGPAGGYTELGAADRFEISGQVLFIVDNYDDKLKNKKLDEQMDLWMYTFNKYIGSDVKVCTGDSSNELSNAWTWIDKQECEIVEINGRECLKFSGIVGAHDAKFDVDSNNYVTGYIFNIEHTCEDGSVYTEPMAFVGAYSKARYNTDIDMTDEEKEELNYNVKVMMESMTLNDDLAEGYHETIK